MDVESIAFGDQASRGAQTGDVLTAGSRSEIDSQAQQRIGAAIRRRRRLMGLSLRHLAAACGMSLQQIQKYEVGASSISAAQLWRMAVALAVPVEHLYGRRDPRG